MDNAKSCLEGLTVASPCAVSWDLMKGTERVRDCAQCHLHVYNLSAMTKPEAERLIMEKEGRLCVRFFQRADGTVITQDCPVGLRAVRLKFVRMAAAVTAMLAMLAGGLGLRRRVAVAPVLHHTMGEMAPIMGAFAHPRDAQ